MRFLKRISTITGLIIQSQSKESCEPACYETPITTFERMTKQNGLKIEDVLLLTKMEDISLYALKITKAKTNSRRKSCRKYYLQSTIFVVVSTKKIVDWIFYHQSPIFRRG